MKALVCEERNGLVCTTVNQPIIDLLKRNGDEQIITESLANYYDEHNESFDGLEVPENLWSRFRNNNPSKVERATRDIDGNWIGEFPTMEEMEKALRNAVKEVDSSLDVQANRTFGERKSAGFRIINEIGEFWLCSSSIFSNSILAGYLASIGYFLSNLLGNVSDDSIFYLFSMGKIDKQSS